MTARNSWPKAVSQGFALFMPEYCDGRTDFTRKNSTPFALLK
jgi:hypothetical protein